MKKTFTVFCVILIMVFGVITLSGCSKKEENASGEYAEKNENDVNSIVETLPEYGKMYYEYIKDNYLTSSVELISGKFCENGQNVPTLILSAKENDVSKLIILYIENNEINVRAENQNTSVDVYYDTYVNQYGWYIKIINDEEEYIGLSTALSLYTPREKINGAFFYDTNKKVWSKVGRTEGSRLPLETGLILVDEGDSFIFDMSNINSNLELASAIKNGIDIYKPIENIITEDIEKKTEEKIKQEKESINNSSEDNISSNISNMAELVVKNGVYNMVLTEEDCIYMREGDTYLEIEDGTITIINGFAQLAQIGTFKVEGNKLVGTYNTIKYLDHSNRGQISEKPITDVLEFEILSDGTLKDTKGFGGAIGNLQYVNATYKFSSK